MAGIGQQSDGIADYAKNDFGNHKSRVQYNADQKCAPEILGGVSMSVIVIMTMIVPVTIAMSACMRTMIGPPAAGWPGRWAGKGS